MGDGEYANARDGISYGSTHHNSENNLSTGSLVRRRSKRKPRSNFCSLLGENDHQRNPHFLRALDNTVLDLEFGSNRSLPLEEKGYPERFCGDVELSERLHCRGGTEVRKTTFIAERSPIHSRKHAGVSWTQLTILYRKIPIALAEHVEKNNLQGKLKYNLFVGASSGAETENRWARNNMINRRSPHQVGKDIAKGINNGQIKFWDKHLSMFPVDLMYGFYTLDKPHNRLDVTIVEASAITEDGGIIPGASVGATPELVQMADKVIIEVNTASPNYEGLHDITMTDLPPNRKPYLVMSPEDRIGTPHVPVDPEKVIAIVESDYADQTQPNAPADATSKAIAGNLIEFLEHEVSKGRLPPNLLPLQSGIGNIANAVIEGLASGGANFKNLKVWTEVLQDSFLDLFDSGNLDFATATSIRFSPEGFQRFYKGWEEYSPKLLLRSQQVSNSPEIIRRLGVIG